MSAIITDQIRILNAQNFLSLADDTENNSFYAFIGLPNPSDVSSTWDSSPPAPKDSFEQEFDYWDTMIALKKIPAGDIRQVIRKITWTSGTTYDMYRHDISRTNLARPSNATSLYSSNFYVMNSDYRVYICLQNGTTPETPNGKPSLDEPLFTDLEPQLAGDSGDGYVWKYLFTIKPADIVKFDSINFIPVPRDWDTSAIHAPIKDNAESSGQIKIITIKNRGIGLGTGGITFTDVPIMGDGDGATATIVINNDSKVDTITIASGGQGYTHGRVDISKTSLASATIPPQFDVIIPPVGGHGFNIYRELGSTNVLLYTRIENDTSNPDFIVGNQVSRIGIVQNPTQFGSNTSLLTADKVSSLYALKLSGIGYSSASFEFDSFITQTVGLGSTAVGRVVSYDRETGVLKYWQDKATVGFNTDGTQRTPQYGYKIHRFTSDFETGGSLTISGGSIPLSIDNNFTGITTTINNNTYNLGQNFFEGVSNPEVQKYSGNIIYVDNRPSITRSKSQKEDIKVVLQF
jgi:hypothetical protein